MAKISFLDILAKLWAILKRKGDFYDKLLVLNTCFFEGNIFFICKNIDFAQIRGKKSIKLEVSVPFFSLKFIILGAKLLRIYIFCLCEHQEKK